MGAVFLYRETEKIDIENAEKVFFSKGFPKYRKFSLGEWSIITYAKIATGFQNYCFIEDDAVFAVGTPIYKSLNYIDSLVQLLLDYRSDKLDIMQLLGHYNLIFSIKGNISVLCDSLNIKHLFTDNQYRFYTSSFLAAVAAYSGGITLNKMAIYEKFLSGIIVSPDTLLKEIIQLDSSMMNKINRKNTGIRFIQNSFNIDYVDYHCLGKKPSVKHQGEMLKNYFNKIKAAAEEKGVDLGLSGGYDSRLLLAVADLCFHNSLHGHTHSTGHVHDKEKQIALKMARLKGIPCSVVKTKRLDEPGVDIDRVLQENLYFFDGRTSFDIGGLSPTYTASYRTQATGGRGFTMTGVGGEIYRNNFSILGNKINMQRFLNDHVFNNFFDKAVRNESLTKQVKDFHMAKVENKLVTGIKGRVEMLIARRYYSEIMMPEGQGVVIDAYNQISSCIAPMLEPKIIKEAYKGLKYHGYSGGYEGAIIQYLDPALAHINSTYGYPFDKVPFKHKVKECIRAHIPARIWSKLARIKGSSLGDSNKEYLDSLCQKSPLLDDAMLYLKRVVPDVDYEKLFLGQSAVSNIAYMALVLYQWKGRLRHSE